MNELRYACVAAAFHRNIRQLGLDDQSKMQEIERLLRKRSMTSSSCDDCQHRKAIGDGTSLPRPCPGPHARPLKTVRGVAATEVEAGD